MKFYIPVIHSITRKSGKLHHIVYRSDKITLHGNLSVETLSKIVSTIQDGANTGSANTFLSREKCSECLPSPFTYSCQTISKTSDSFINWTCRKLFLSSGATFNLKKLFCFVSRSPDMTSAWYSNLELLRGHCSFSSICGQFSWRPISIASHGHCYPLHVLPRFHFQVKRPNSVWRNRD